MKSTGADKTMSERLDGLSTLSGGIVFGKEEAWDKLQARLEKKPVRIIPLRIWLAAAAVLLLMMGTIGFYFYPTKEVAQTEVKKQPKQPAPVYATVAPTTAIPTEATPQHMAVIHKDNNYIVSVPQKKKKETPVITNTPEKILPPQEPVIERFVTEYNRVEDMPGYAPKPMKVVHINELGNAEPQAASPQVYNPVVVNTNVVHINDLTDENNTNNLWLQNVAGHHEAFAVNFSFMSNMRQQGPYEASETTHNHLKLKLN